MKGWYLKRSGIRAGPFSGAEVESLFDQRKILPGDQIRQSGSREWLPAQRFANPERTDTPADPPLADRESERQAVAGTPQQQDGVPADEEGRPAPAE